MKKKLVVTAMAFMLMGCASDSYNTDENPINDQIQDTNSVQDVISEEQAVEIAFERAGATEAEVTGLRAHLEFDDLRHEWEVSFIFNGVEYDVTIDAVSGRIRDYDMDYEDNLIDVEDTNLISEEQAMAIAFERAGVSESEVTGLRVHLDRDDFRHEWEVSFVFNGMEYDVTIDAASGTVIDYDVELDD